MEDEQGVVGNAIKNAAKQAFKKVGQAILEAIKPALPYIAVGMLIIIGAMLVISLFVNFSQMGITASAASMSDSSDSSWAQFLQFVLKNEGRDKN